MIRICLKIGILVLFNSMHSISWGSVDDSQRATIIKVWGFLNYNNKYILETDIDWDSELILALDEYDSSQSFTKAIEVLFNKLPNEVIPKKELKIDANNHRFEWIESDTFLDASLKKRLITMAHGRKPFPNRFVAQNYKGVVKLQQSSTLKWNLQIKNHRLLSLAKYWNIMKYFNPYLELLPSWDDSLLDMLPVFSNVRNETDFYRALLRLNAILEDSHSLNNVFPMEAGNEIFGSHFFPYVQLETVGDTLFIADVDSAMRAKFQKGDVLMKIDGKPIAFFIDSLARFVSLSRGDVSRLRGLLLRSTHTQQIWQIKRAEQLIEVEVSFDSALPRISKKTFTCTSQQFSSVYYLNPEGCSSTEFKNKLKIARGYENVILDMRGYPSGLHEQIVSFFAPRGRHFATLKVVDGDHPGSFKFLKERTPIWGQRYKNNLVVLVSNETISASEYVVMAIQQNPKAKVVGTPTAGANGDVLSFQLPGEFVCLFSSVGVYYPDGATVQKRGIRIDVPVQETVEGYFKEDMILEIGKKAFE